MANLLEVMTCYLTELKIPSAVNGMRMWAGMIDPRLNDFQGDSSD